jgi:hypothetical protein
VSVRVSLTGKASVRYFIICLRNLAVVFLHNIANIPWSVNYVFGKLFSVANMSKRSSNILIAFKRIPF